MRKTLFLIPFVAFASATVGQAAVDSFSYETVAPPVPSYAIYAPSGSDLARGQAALTAGDYARAVKLLEPLADGSGNPQIKLLAGYANLGAGRFRKAERHFDAALSLDFGSPYAHLGLGLAAIAQGNPAGAVAQLGLIDQARGRCAHKCSRAVELEQAAQSLRRALG